MKLLILLFFLFMIFPAMGQNKQLLYNFDALPQSLMSNPGGETTFDIHFGVPLLSQIYVSAGSSGVSMYDVFKDDGGSINTRILSLLPEMTEKDFFSLNQQLEILFLGWRDQKKRYYSAGIYQEMDVFLYFPKDLAVLVYEGNKDHLSESFHFSDAAFTAEFLNVFHLGFTNYYSEDFNYGFRAKLYSSVFNARSVNNRGIFRTIPSPAGGNSYRHFLSGIDILINTSGFAPLVDAENATGLSTMKTLGRKMFLGGNLGLGLDFGFTYYLNNRVKITGSVIDLGFINYSKDIENYRYHGNYQTDGIGLEFPENGESSPPYWNQWENDLEDHLKDETLYNSYIAWRPVKFNASIDLGINENHEPCNCHKPQGRRRYYNYLGFQLFSIKRPKGFLHAATVSFDKLFSEKFRGKITYTASPYSLSNIGMLFSAQINNFNFYLAADNLLKYTNLAKAHHASVQLGFQFIIDRE